MKVIGLTGKAGAGKDTAAAMALEWCKDRLIVAKRMAFADPLKRSAAAALGFPTGGMTGHHVSEAVEFCNRIKQPDVRFVVYVGEGHDDEYIELTGRRFLQLYGTEAHRDVFGADFWVEVTERMLAELEGFVDVVFLTDPRFQNEADMIHRHGGEVWEVVRPGLEAVEAHASEAGLPEGAIEFQINNAGSLDDLRATIHSVCECNLEEAK